MLQADIKPLGIYQIERVDVINLSPTITYSQYIISGTLNMATTILHIVSIKHLQEK